MGKPPSPPKKITAKKAAAEANRVEDRSKAFALKKAGVGYRQIGVTLGVSTGKAHNLVHEVLEELSAQAIEDAKYYRDEQWARLEDLLMPLQDKARKGDPQAIDRILRVLERQAALRGLDMPRKIAPTTPDGDPLPPPPMPPSVNLTLLSDGDLSALEGILQRAESNGG